MCVMMCVRVQMVCVMAHIGQKTTFRTQLLPSPLLRLRLLLSLLWGILEAAWPTASH